MNIIYRDYTDKDESILIDFIHKLEEYVKPLDPLGRVKNLPGFAEASAKETLEDVRKFQGKIWFAENEGKVIGCIVGIIKNQSEVNTLEIGPHKIGEIVELYVEPEYRGNGIGKTMIEMMESYFKEKECDSLWISVFSPNEYAHTMYKKFGFVDREVGMLKQLS